MPHQSPSPEPESDLTLRPLAERLTQIGTEWRARPIATAPIANYLRALASEGRRAASRYPLQEEYDFMQTAPAPPPTPPAPRSRWRGWVIIPTAAALVVALLVGVLVAARHNAPSSPPLTTLMPTPEMGAAVTLQRFSTGKYAIVTLLAGTDGALWCTALSKDAQQHNNWAIGHITADGHAIFYPIPAGTAPPVSAVPGAMSVETGIGVAVVGADGNLWFSLDTSYSRSSPEQTVLRVDHMIGRMSPAGEFAAFPFAFPTAESATVSYAVNALAVRGDGTIWLTASKWVNGIVRGGEIGEVTATGAVTWRATDLLTAPGDIAPGIHNDLWFTDGYQLGHIAANGTISPVPLGESLDHVFCDAQGEIWLSTSNGRLPVLERFDPTIHARWQVVLPGSSYIKGLAVDAQHNVWLTGFVASTTSTVQTLLYRITLAGTIEERPIPHTWSTSNLVIGQDGGLWFGDFENVNSSTPPSLINYIAHITP